MAEEPESREKMAAVLRYWLEHNRGHLEENRKWASRARNMGFEEVALELERITGESRAHARSMERLLEHVQGEPGGAHEEAPRESGLPHRHIQLHQIGVIHTPYPPDTPWEEMQEERGDCVIEVDPGLAEGLQGLESFRYLIVLFFFHRSEDRVSLHARPPCAKQVEVGVFASRSPHRPNHIGLAVTELKGVADNRITTGRIDVYDGTPLLDLKPYIERSDCVPGAGNGWLDEQE
ncbi:MAG: tRNA (N6-threonylcarbamoyladenosine(37)-N6)-methyltransferase TrmO [Spirochaetota bacterium]